MARWAGATALTAGARGAPGGGMGPPPSGAKVLRCVRQQRHEPGALERNGQLALVRGARSGLATRLDPGPLREIAAEAADPLVVDLGRLFGAERPHLWWAAIAVVVVSLPAAGYGGHRVNSCGRGRRRRGERPACVSERKVVDVGRGVVPALGVMPDRRDGRARRTGLSREWRRVGAFLPRPAVEVRDLVGDQLRRVPLLAL